MGDRFTYLASLGLFIPLGQVFWNLFECKKQRLLPLAVLGAYTVFLVGATRMRCEVWKNADTLWGDVLRHYDQVPLAHVNRGNSYFQQGNATAAIGEFSKAIALGYDLDMAYYNRGVAFFSTKQYDRAAADFSVVLKYSKDDKDALLSRAISYIHLDRKKESLADFDHYIALDSMNADAYAKRGVMRIQTGDSTGACMDWQRAVKLGSKETLQVLDLYCK
jgi:tetratricopeptide (TPR) repeat protein